jgi:PAS domain-containing protein
VAHGLQRAERIGGSPSPEQGKVRTLGMKHWARAGLLATAVGLAVLGSVSFGRRLWGTQPALGVSWTPSSVGPIATDLEAGSPAERAGLRVGDVLLSVDGQPARGALREVSLPWAASERAVRVEVRRGGARLSLSLRADLAHQAPDLYGYLSLVGLAFLVSGVFVLWRWPSLRGSGVYAALAASLFTALVFSHTGAGGPLDWTIFWMDLAAGALAPALLVDLALSLSRRAVPTRALVRLCAYPAAAPLLLLAFWGVQGNGALRFPDPAAAIQGLDRLQNLFLGAAVAAAAAVMGAAYTRSRSLLHRGQLRWMLWGLGIGLAPFTLLYLLPWTLGAAVPAWAQFLAVVPLLAVPPFFTAALVRYRLDDLGLILRRGSVEVTAAFCTMAVYALTVLVLRWLGEGGLLPLTRNVARWVAILPAAITYPQLRTWVRAGVERAFFKKRYSYRATLLDFARELNAESDLAQLLERLRERVMATLGIEEARVLVRVEGDGFEAADGTRVAFDGDNPAVRAHARLEPGSLPALPWARHLFAMRVKGSLRALLVVSDRGDGPLTSEDLSLLSTLAAHASTAIEAARLLREVRGHAAEVGRLQSRQERILESSGVGLLLADGDGRILAWKPSPGDDLRPSPPRGAGQADRRRVPRCSWCAASSGSSMRGTKDGSTGRPWSTGAESAGSSTSPSRRRAPTGKRTAPGSSPSTTSPTACRWRSSCRVRSVSPPWACWRPAWRTRSTRRSPGSRATPRCCWRTPLPPIPATASWPRSRTRAGGSPRSPAPCSTWPVPSGEPSRISP